MKYCKDCVYYDNKKCHVSEYSPVTGERSPANLAIDAAVERGNNTPAHCGKEAKLFLAGEYVPRPAAKKAPAPKKAAAKKPRTRQTAAKKKTTKK